jgi:hypothetical protein
MAWPAGEERRESLAALALSASLGSLASSSFFAAPFTSRGLRQELGRAAAFLFGEIAHASGLSVTIFNGEISMHAPSSLVFLACRREGRCCMQESSGDKHAPCFYLFLCMMRRVRWWETTRLVCFCWRHEGWHWQVHAHADFHPPLAHGFNLYVDMRGMCGVFFFFLICWDLLPHACSMFA